MAWLQPMFNRAPHVEEGLVGARNYIMFRAIGIVIILIAITKMFGAGVQSFERALVATFETVETAAEVSTQQLIKQSN